MSMGCGRGAVPCRTSELLLEDLIRGWPREQGLSSNLHLFFLLIYSILTDSRSVSHCYTVKHVLPACFTCPDVHQFPFVRPHSCSMYLL